MVKKRKETPPHWLETLYKALPKELDDEEISALLNTILDVFYDDPRKILHTHITCMVVYCRAKGIPMEKLSDILSFSADQVKGINIGAKLN